MNARSWVTLSIRLLGLGVFLFGVVKLIGTVEVASTMNAMNRLGGAGAGEVFQPTYLPAALWLLLGFLLVAASGAVTRMLFVGLDSPPRLAGQP
jgi:hypothetical protein